jgi:hypothetical protein
MVRSGLDRRRLRGSISIRFMAEGDHANWHGVGWSRLMRRWPWEARGSRGRPQSVFRIGSAIASAPKIQNISGLPQGRDRPLTGTLSFVSGDPLAAVRPNGERA